MGVTCTVAVSFQGNIYLSDFGVELRNESCKKSLPGGSLVFGVSIIEPRRRVDALLGESRQESIFLGDDQQLKAGGHRVEPVVKVTY